MSFLGIVGGLAVCWTLKVDFWSKGATCGDTFFTLVWLSVLSSDHNLLNSLAPFC